MTTPGVTGLNGSPVQYFLGSSWQGKAVQVLGIAFISLICYVAYRLIKRDEPEPPSLDPATLNKRVVTNETPVEQALSDKTLPPWLKEMTQKTWEEKIDCKKYGLDFTGAPSINISDSAKSLKALSERVVNNMGITHMVIPKGLTLNIVLQIANDYKVPISPDWGGNIFTKFGDVRAEQTRVLFFTNSILNDTKHHAPEQDAADLTKIGKECGVAIQRPNVRDFMAFLVLTHISSSETPPTQLYSSGTYTRLLEKVDDNTYVYGGCVPLGLFARHFRRFDSSSTGIGASGSSEAIL